jgi:hypothetical protein
MIIMPMPVGALKTQGTQNYCLPNYSRRITNIPTPHIVDLPPARNTVTLEITYEGYQLPPTSIEVPLRYFRLPLDYTFDLTALHDLVGERLGLLPGLNSGEGPGRKFHLDWLPPWDGCVDMNGRNQADYQQVCDYVAAGNQVLRMSIEVLDEPAQTEFRTALASEENRRVRENTAEGEIKPQSGTKSWLRETWRYGFGRPSGS